MDYENIVSLTTSALTLCLLISLPVVATAAVSGLLISFLQAITSLQDSSISQVAKLIIVTGVILAFAPWGASAILQFAQSVTRTIFQ
ncbi:type III secretion system export apparatus subunit SctS [Paraburkholderia xenovorans]|uniref:type III secretion system export apparatus subunit SctS n=1 Tax=Paraburkholderia xenovorans TaxID=36873 RepID=UPI0038BDD8F3